MVSLNLLLFIGSTLARDGGISLAEGCELLKGQLQLNGLRGTVHHFDDIIHFKSFSCPYM